MKIKVLTEVDAPKGATHYWGDLLDEPKFAKTSQEPDGWTYWWWYDPTRQDWFLSEQGPAGTKPHWIKELPTHYAADLREMLRAMQAGEMTVSRGLELLDMWLAGNYSDDQLPQVSEVLPEDKMPWDVIRELRTNPLSGTLGWKQGSLVTLNQDPYPSLGEWFVQFWERGDVAARVYGNDRETLNRRCELLTGGRT